jgi:hypothetical protein
MPRLFRLLPLLVLLVAVAPLRAQDDEERKPWQSQYDAPPLEVAALEQGWTFRAGIGDDWNHQRGMVTLFLPRDEDQDATIEFRLPVSSGRPSPLFVASIKDEARHRLLEEMLVHLDAPDLDTIDDPDEAICVHYWGADTQFAVDGDIVRELPSAACYRNEDLFDFVIELTEAAQVGVPECRDMASEEDFAIYRLWECSLLTGDKALAGRHYQALEDAHDDWPDRSHFTPETHIVWDRSRIVSDPENEEDGLPLDGEVYVLFRKMEGLPQGEVELEMIYKEDYDEGTLEWDAREVWSFAEDGTPQLVSMIVDNLKVIPEED